MSKMENNSEEIHSFGMPLAELNAVTPEIAMKVIALAKRESDNRNEQFNRDFNLKVWALIFSFIITCLALLLGTWLVFAGHRDAGMLTIACGAGLTIAGNLIKKAAHLVSDRFLSGQG